MPPEAPISPSLLQDAQSLFISRQEVSISLLQRTFKLRHGQALGVVTQLVVANVVHPVNLAGFHILTDAYLTKAHYMHDPLQSHIRQLRDLSLYMVESIEEGHRGNSDAIKTILTTRPALWAEVRTRALDIVNAGSPSPVANLAFNLASMDALASAFTVEQVHYQLAAECSPFASRPAVPLEANEKKRRSYIRLVRYLEQRIIDGFNPSTLAFICFPLDVPFGRGSELVKVGGRSHREHVVPRLLLTNRCTGMLLAGVPLAQVARWVEL